MSVSTNSAAFALFCEERKTHPRYQKLTRSEHEAAWKASPLDQRIYVEMAEQKKRIGQHITQAKQSQQKRKK